MTDLIKLMVVYEKSTKTSLLTFTSGLFLGIAVTAFNTGLLLDQLDLLEAVRYNLLPPVFDRPANINEIYSQQVLEFTNQERRKENKKPLKENSALTYAAYLRAVDIINNDDFSHEATRSALDSEKVADVVGYRYQYLAENLAEGFEHPEQAVEKWMDSPEHKENILDETFSEVGVAALNGRLLNRETTVVVQLFGAR